MDSRPCRGDWTFLREQGGGCSGRSKITAGTSGLVKWEVGEVVLGGEAWGCRGT